MSDDTADRPLPEQFWLSPGYDCDLDLCCQICDWKVTVGATTIASVLDDAKAHIAEKHADAPDRRGASTARVDDHVFGLHSGRI